MMEVDLLNNVLTVDPGKITGWAYWSDTILPETSSFKASKGYANTPLEEQSENMWSHFYRIIRDHDIAKCYIEGVQVWGGSLKSSIASKTGSLFKLAFLIGGYCRVCQENGIPFVIVYPTTWKGQLDDDAIKLRVLRVNDTEYPNPHIADAVAMGFSLMGIL